MLNVITPRSAQQFSYGFVRVRVMKDNLRVRAIVLMCMESASRARVIVVAAYCYSYPTKSYELLRSPFHPQGF